MAWNHQSHQAPTGMGATFVPGSFDDDYYMPVATPPLIAPEPQRINPEMPNQIADGIHNMDLNSSKRGYSNLSELHDPPHLSPFPKLVNPPPNVPPSDDELETRLENAREPVLNSNDPEMQLAWAQDALTHCGVCADEAERLAAMKPLQARASTPRIEHQLKTDAMNIVTFLADQHHPRAEFLRGMWLEWGRFGQREDKKEAFRCYSRAADRGYARAEYRIGMLYESYNDPIKALRHYHRGVDAGDSASCYRLGMMTIRGQHGQQQDLAKAVDLIRRSAESADENAAQGAYVFGMLLARQLPQIDVPESYLEFNEQLARQNIEKAAYMKFAKAQAKMGSMYELGSLGCEFNPALSMHYNALASKQGEADADMALSKWFLVGSEGIFPKNEELAYTYAERAAATALPTAEFALGYFNEIGMHVAVNLDKASEWYQKAAKHGNGDAKARLDALSKKQVLSKSDHEKVAINRIKSQHGSMRGQRPERFRQKQESSMGTVTEAAPYGNAAVRLPPSRGSSRTPYPEDNAPPRPDQRPASAAPYPMGNGPPPAMGPMGQGPVGGFFAAQHPETRPASNVYLPEIRPGSAFQLNPEARPNSTANVPMQQGAQRPYGGGLAPPPGVGFRPQTAQPYDRKSSAPAHAPDGRPLHPNDPRARPTMNTRVASVPAGMMQQGRPPTTGPPPPPGPGHLSHQPTSPAGLGLSPSPLRPGGMDIGFSAPHQQRPQTVDPTYQEKKLARRRESGNYQRESMPNFDQQPLSRPGSKPPPGDRRATPNSSGGAPTPPIKQGGPSQAPPKTQPNAPRPPGKGPKTFEEMGVPAHDKDKECIVM
ncbi:Chitin synthase regulatory factor 3 [Lecanosticta acicola]|uniref:Chitin synthase regulatory factor 3 n=1 Tax=Lecanosticta acicola TaxID=111012 RepID=A0AAI9EDN1_9PEZI|nr:Chitin synthase regulatory factor 3 [Lecanosticta acicola]